MTAMHWHQSHKFGSDGRSAGGTTICRMSNVEHDMKTALKSVEKVTKSSFSVYMASPGVLEEDEKGEARYKRVHANRRARSGPTGEVGNKHSP